MQDLQLDKQQMQAVERVPFLSEFPYPEYQFHYQLMQTINLTTGQPVGEPYDVVLFSHRDDAKTMVHVMEKELWHLYEIRDNVGKMNEISKQVESALNSGDVRIMSRSVREAEEWFKGIKGKNFNVGAGTFTDILHGYIGQGRIDMLTQISWLLDRLHRGRGIIYVSPEEKEILLKYYKFQLVYYRMLIGIIIAAKISM